MQFPHCDTRVLHAPRECPYCDELPEWQQLRIAWGIAFTGHDPAGEEPFCLAEFSVDGLEYQACLQPRGHGGHHIAAPAWEQHRCPADAARPPGGISDHRNWGGNRP